MSQEPGTAGGKKKGKEKCVGVQGHQLAVFLVQLGEWYGEDRRLSNQEARNQENGALVPALLLTCCVTLSDLPLCSGVVSLLVK